MNLFSFFFSFHDAANWNILFPTKIINSVKIALGPDNQRQNRSAQENQIPYKGLKERDKQSSNDNRNPKPIELMRERSSSSQTINTAQKYLRNREIRSTS